MKHCYLLASEKACTAARSVVVTPLILGRLPRAAAPAAPRTPSGFSVFSEISLLFAGRAWTPDRSTHKLKIKLKDDPLLSLSAELQYSSRHGHHSLTCGCCPSWAARVPLCHGGDPEARRVHTRNTQHGASLCWQQGFCEAAFVFYIQRQVPITSHPSRRVQSPLGQLYSQGTVAIASFKKFFFPSIPALLCNRDGTELCLFLWGLR